MYNIKISKGATVVRDREYMVELRGDVYVDAVRADDGGYFYRIGDSEYYVAAGVVEGGMSC